MQDGDGDRTIAVNRRARYDYELGERFEAGLVLTGTEVKSLRAGKASLVEAWVKVDAAGEGWLMQSHIEEYRFGYQANHDPTRPRKLLLHRRELVELSRTVARQGVSLIPTKLYFHDGKAKVQFAIARGKSKGDKRRAIAEREANREAQRAVKVRR